MSILHDPHIQKQPLFAPRSLIIRFANIVPYDTAKEFLEGLGLTVREKGLSWEKRHILHVTTPDENLKSWMLKLHTNPLIHLVEKEIFSYPKKGSRTIKKEPGN